jgi:uncharacterized membrane protein YhhN
MENVVTVREIRVAAWSWRETLGAGTLAGAAGGVLMAAAAMIHAAVTGAGVLFPVRLIGASFGGPLALVDGADALVFGLALHLLTSMLFGMLFAVIVDRATTPGVAVLAGVAFGIGVLALMTFVVVPMVNPTMQARIPLMPGMWFTMHALYGLGLALAPSLRRQIRKDEDLRGATPVPI